PVVAFLAHRRPAEVESHVLRLHDITSLHLHVLLGLSLHLLVESFVLLEFPLQGDGLVLREGRHDQGQECKGDDPATRAHVQCLPDGAVISSGFACNGPQTSYCGVKCRPRQVRLATRHGRPAFSRVEYSRFLQSPTCKRGIWLNPRSRVGLRKTPGTTC